MAQIQIPPNAHGDVRLFALSMTDAQARALRDDTRNHPGAPAPLVRALGTDLPDPGGVEVIQVSDLAGLGLGGYLIDGVDADPDAVRRDQRKLAAIDGWVMLVYAGAFDGRATVLDPAPEVALIGTYPLMQADATTLPLECAAARPYTGAPTSTPPAAVPGRARWTMTVAALGALVLLLVWWVLS